MTFSEDDPRPRVRARVDPSLKQQVEAQEGTTASFVRKALRDALDVSSVDDPYGVVLPRDDDKLAEAYRVLHGLAGDAGWINGDVAASELSQQLSMSKRSIRRQILGRLCTRGYLRRTADCTGQFVSYRLNHYNNE